MSRTSLAAVLILAGGVLPGKAWADAKTLVPQESIRFSEEATLHGPGVVVTSSKSTLHVVAKHGMAIMVAAPSSSADSPRFKKIANVKAEHPDLVEIVPIGPTAIIVNGVEPGETTLTLIDEQYGTYTINVVVTKNPAEYQASPGQTPPQIMIQAIVVQIDWKKLKEAGIDLGATVRAFGIRNEGDEAASQPAAKSGALMTVPYAKAAAPRLLKLLSALDAVKVLSRPQVQTVTGRPASVTVGRELPILQVEEVVNGKVQSRIESRSIGINLDLTPTLLKTGEIQLTLSAEESRPVKSDNEEGLLGIRSRIFKCAVTLKPRQTIVIADAAPNEENLKAIPDKGLMIVATPVVVDGEPQPHQPAAPSLQSSAGFRIEGTDIPTADILQQANLRPHTGRMSPQQIQQTLKALQAAGWFVSVTVEPRTKSGPVVFRVVEKG